MINGIIDEFTPCLKDEETGELVQTDKGSLYQTPDPILLSQISQKMDLRGLVNYAKQKGVKVEQLSVEERLSFLK